MFRRTRTTLALLPVAVAGLSFAGPALADERDAHGPSVYLSAGAADTSASLELDSDCRWCEPWSDTGESGSGYSLGIGVQLNRWFAIEGGFLDATEAGWRQADVPVPGLPGRYDTDVALDVRATSLSAVARLPLGAFDLNARLGEARVEGTSRQLARDVFDGRLLARDVERTRTGLTAGIGAGLSVGEHVRFALDASLLPLDRALLAERDGDASLVVVGVSVAVRFGL